MATCVNLITMRPRPIVPPGKAGLFVIAVATVPLILSKCKPFAKRVGSKLVEWGEKLQKEETETTMPEAAKAPANTNVSETKEEAVKTSTSAPVEDMNKPPAPKTAAKKSAPKAKPTAAKKPVTSTKAGTGNKAKKAPAKPKA